MSTGPEPPAGAIAVEVVYATPSRQVLVRVEVEDGCTVAE
jgi:putative ubiquitin-RnfH superfamily antitoxin RatB of RatAB toxin-antitoxin module